jgi:hypothetical protein
MSSDPTNFFSLSGELRNEIYKLALVQSNPVSVDARGLIPRILDPPPNPRVLALLLVNKQVYTEATAIFYHNNSFRIVTNGLNHLPDWRPYARGYLRALGKFHNLYIHNPTRMILCGHLWPATFEDWIHRIGTTNAGHIRNLDFDMASMKPFNSFRALGYTPDFELRLRLHRESIAASLAAIARSVAQQGCSCTATITLRNSRNRKPLEIKIDLIQRQNGELHSISEKLYGQVEDHKSIATFLNDLQHESEE